MPAWLRRLRARIKYRHFDSDLATEMESHRRMASEALEPNGERRPDTARRVAIEFGNATLAREDARAVWIPLVLRRWHTDALWAWRGLRARRWRAPLSIALLAFALTANTLLFAAVDSLLLRPINHADPESLATLMVDRGTRAPRSRLMLEPPTLLDDLRTQRDVFAGLHGYMTGTYTFIMDAATPKQEPTTFVTPGLIEMLGWQAKAGRSLIDSDMARTDQRAALVAESLAIERFGSAKLAVGRTLETSEDPLVIAGVMPKAFQFPDSRARVWRVLDYREVSDGALYTLARLQPGTTPEKVEAALNGVGSALAAAGRIPKGSRVLTAPFAPVQSTSSARLWTLVAAALCLLIIACANIASLEIAGAISRSRVSSIQVAMGATTSNLVRTSVIEGAAVVAAAFVLAWGGCWLLQDSIAEWLPPRMTRFAANPIDLDARASIYMTALAALSWLGVSLPLALHASRRTVSRALTELSHQASAPLSAARLRRVLTVLEVALSVMLVIGGVLYTRTYAALIGLDKGFDSSRVVAVDLTLPTAQYSAPGSTKALIDQITTTLSARPDVEAFTRLQASVFDVNTTLTTLPEIDDQPPASTPLVFALRTVDPPFFETMQLHAMRGRLFDTGEDPTNIIITPGLAKRLWPDTDPIGHRLRTDPKQPWLSVVGVIPHLRYASEIPGDRYQDMFQIYVPPKPPTPRPGTQALTHITAASPSPTPTGVRPNVPRPGAIFMFLNFAARLGPGASIEDLSRALRSIDSRFAMEIEPVDATYAAAHKERLLAARTVGVFAALSFLVAIAGLYGVMAFLVANRRREMGIRLALGASERQVRALVLGSATRLVVVGGLIGTGVAALCARWIRAQLYGVAPTDALTYAAVTVAFVLAAIVATWLPARQASRADPATILRQD